MPDSFIHVRDLCKTFHVPRRREGISGALIDLVALRKDRLDAVQKVSFDIAAGERVGYLGPNGAGKSTTIKMLTGILSPTSGRISVGGLVPHQDRVGYVRNIGVVFGQKSGLWWELAPIESFRLLAKIYEVPGVDFDQRMKEFDEVLKLGRLLHTPVRKLSLGERMRCELAAGLLHNPRVIFLDEPTIGLDVLSKVAVREFLRHINTTRGTTLILTTHDLKDVEELTPRIIIIDHGKILFDGATSAVRQRLRETEGLDFRLKVLLRDEWPADATPTAALKALPVTFTVVSPLELSVQFLPEKIERGELVRALFSEIDARRNSVIDLQFIEPQIEDIIRRLYTESSAAAAAADAALAAGARA